MLQKPCYKEDKMAVSEQNPKNPLGEGGGSEEMREKRKKTYQSRHFDQLRLDDDDAHVLDDLDEPLHFHVLSQLLNLFYLVVVALVEDSFSYIYHRQKIFDVLLFSSFHDL
jgi:hypothetical protein